MTVRESARVLAAGCGGEGGQHHQRDMYLPAIVRNPGVSLCGIWDGGDGRANELASAYGVRVETDLKRAMADCNAVIACPRPDAVNDVVAAATEHGRPVLLDKPTLFGTTALAALAEQHGSATVTAAHHWRFHAAVESAQTAVRSGQLGLVHAIHGELLVGGPDGPHTAGELRNLVVYLLDVLEALAGPLQGTAYAVRSAPADGAGEAWTVSLRLRPDVVATLLVGRAQQAVTQTVHRYRILASHGQLLLDLTRPRLDLVAGRLGAVPFGPSSVDRLVEAFLAGTATDSGLATALRLSRALDVIEASAASRTVKTFGGAEA